MIDLFETNVKSGNLRIGSLPLNFLIVLLCHNKCNHRKNCIYQAPACPYSKILKTSITRKSDNCCQPKEYYECDIPTLA